MQGILAAQLLALGLQAQLVKRGRLCRRSKPETEQRSQWIPLDAGTPTPRRIRRQRGADTRRSFGITSAW
jgi:hypothetical protein